MKRILAYLAEEAAIIPPSVPAMPLMFLAKVRTLALISSADAMAERKARSSPPELSLKKVKNRVHRIKIRVNNKAKFSWNKEDFHG